jgi:hypothetical protein
MEPCAILDYFLDLDTLITELPQQIYSGILILFNLLTLVISVSLLVVSSWS